MQRLEVSGAVRPIYGSLGVKGLITLNLLWRLKFSILPSILYILRIAWMWPERPKHVAMNT